MARVVFLLVLTVGIASQAMAAKRVSVAELEQLLAAAHGQSDGKVAKQLSELELTERASSVRLARWETEFPGHHCHEALTELADASAFLSLPAADIPANPPPDVEEQNAMFARAFQYVNTTISKLPNFYATRRTEHFEDTPAQATIERGSATPIGRGARSTGLSSSAIGQSSYEPIHLAGKSTVTVSYQDGFELRGSKKIDIRKFVSSQQGLNTAGEFGPILSVALGDAIMGKIFWSHWEQGSTALAANGIEAVFRFTVPQEKSSFSVVVPHGRTVDELHPAYHGEIAIDPANGDILRISVVADLAPPYQSMTNSVLVEYGSIPIGGTNYICPVKSVALSKAPFYVSEGGKLDGVSPMRTQVNDVAFIDYHLFRAEARILTGESVGKQETPADIAPPPAQSPR
jgi:hypothetical protein